VAGNSALSTVKCQKADLPADEYVIVGNGEKPIQGFFRR